jgi:hypothetical protein
MAGLIHKILKISLSQTKNFGQAGNHTLPDGGNSSDNCRYTLKLNILFCVSEKIHSKIRSVSNNIIHTY